MGKTAEWQTGTPTGDPTILDPVERLAVEYLEASDGNPSYALRMLALHVLNLERSVREQEKFVSRGYVRAAGPRCLAKGAA